ILTGLLCVVMWSPPMWLSNSGLFWYFLIVSILYFTTFAVFAVPYTALGYELSNDYNERTKVMAFKVFIMSLGGGILLPWAYKLCFKFGDNEREGARVVGLIFGFIIIVTGCMPALFCKENSKASEQSQIPFFRALIGTFKNRGFRIICGIIFFMIVGFFLANPLYVYINIAYIYGGNKEMAASMAGYSGLTYCIFGFAAVPLINYCAKKWGKRITLLAGIAFVTAGFGSSWFFFNDKYPYLQLLFGVLVSPGMSCIWVLTASCMADICDLDELETGLRREGMYGAVYAWLLKVGLAAVLAISGYIIEWSGFDREVAIQSSSVIFNLRIMFAFIPIAFLCCAAILTWRYPVTKEKIEEVQMLLANKK
ncbi:MAG: MFS transporter, partial [Phycisphaerales bacterium]